jgi:DNA-binding MarR family transcriptional regulator
MVSPSESASLLEKSAVLHGTGLGGRCFSGCRSIITDTDQFFITPVFKMQVSFALRDRDLQNSIFKSPPKKLLTGGIAFINVVNIMNKSIALNNNQVSQYQASRLKTLIEEISFCCQERLLILSQKFHLTQAELRTILLFKNERYLTVTSMAQKLEVAKSRVTKVLDGLMKKKMIQRIDDPEDARIKLISLTSTGQRKTKEIDEFTTDMHHQLVLSLNPEERKSVIGSLEVLRASMEMVKASLK